jgi:hypothetical protein
LECGDKSCAARGSRHRFPEPARAKAASRGIPLAAVRSKRGDLAWETTVDGHALIRDIRLDDEIEICFK